MQLSASASSGRMRLARLLMVASLGNSPWARSLLSIAFTVLVTGIGMSCVLASVLDGHPVIFAVP